MATHDDQPGRADLPDHAGLCASCVHAQAVRSARGSTFLLCRYSTVDPRYPKYPPLPVRACAAYNPSTA